MTKNLTKGMTEAEVTTNAHYVNLIDVNQNRN
jgi:hypothetical protein